MQTRVPSPVVPVPGVGQVGLGLQNTWGLEEEDDDDDDDEEEEAEECANRGEEGEEKVTKMEVERHKKDASREGRFT